MIALKNNTFVVLLNLVCVIAAFLLVYSGKVSWPHAEAFVLGLMLPSSIGWKPRTAPTEKSEDPS